MKCRGCKNEHAYRITTFMVDGELNDRCDRCGDTSSGPLNPDVYYGYGSGTHIEENIADPATGKPIPFSSKREKWEAMKKAGVIEAGDRVKGYRREDMVPQNRKKYFT